MQTYRTDLLTLGLCGVVLVFTTAESRAQCHGEVDYKLQMARYSNPATGVTQNVTIVLWLKTGTGNSNGEDWGSMTTHICDLGIPGSENCDSGKDNCAGEDYCWSELEININWAVTLNGITFNQSHGVAYWDWIYEIGNYIRVGNQLDYSKNCHGHAIGVGDWPAPDIYGAGTLIHEGVCYDKSDEPDTNVIFSTTDGYQHSIIVTVQEWQDEYTSFFVITNTSEKWGESPVYTRTAPPNASLLLLIPSALGGSNGISFKYYSLHPAGPAP